MSIRNTYTWLLVAYLMFVTAAICHADPLKIEGRPPTLPAAIVGTAWYVFADGEIDKGADGRLDRYLEENHVPGKSLLYLNSPGGDLATGIKLGKVIRKHRLFTYVGKDAGIKKRYDTAAGECYSACALAFLGGDYRFYKSGSDYGVHRFYWFNKDENDAGCTDCFRKHHSIHARYGRQSGVI